MAELFFEDGPLEGRVIAVQGIAPPVYQMQQSVRDRPAFPDWVADPESPRDFQLDIETITYYRSDEEERHGCVSYYVRRF